MFQIVDRPFTTYFSHLSFFLSFLSSFLDVVADFSSVDFYPRNFAIELIVLKIFYDYHMFHNGRTF